MPAPSPPSPPASPRPSRLPNRPGAVAVALATLALMVATEPRLAIVWDEGYTLGREARIRAWFRGMIDPAAFSKTWIPPAPGAELVQNRGEVGPRGGEVDTRGKLLSPRVMSWFWPFAREEPHGHPPFYAIVGLAGDLLAPGWEVLPRARLGPILAFSLAAGALFAGLGRRFGPWAGALAAGAWVLQPNLFGHGHYATLDGLLAALWVGALLAFGRAVEAAGRSPRWPWAIGFGVLCGWAADTKLTGWFLPLPFLALDAPLSGSQGGVDAGRRRDRRGLRAPGVQPLLVERSRHRGRAVLPVQPDPGADDPDPGPVPGPDLRDPEPVLALVQHAGLDRAGDAGGLPGPGPGRGPGGRSRGRGSPAPKRRRSRPWPCCTGGSSWPSGRLPHTPGHDGVRLFLPAFGMLAVVAGVGAAWLAGRPGRWGRVLVGASLVEGALSVALMMPVPLSYFSPIVGGLPGAARLGMEPTYFWDGLPADAIAWLERHTPAGRSVRFANVPDVLALPPANRPAPGPALAGRAGPARLVRRAEPAGRLRAARTRSARDGPAGVCQVSRLGVPLVLIYPYPRATACRPSGSAPPGRSRWTGVAAGRRPGLLGLRRRSRRPATSA